MNKDNTPNILGITRKELSDTLVHTFEEHRGTGYFYNDANYDDHSHHVNLYDKMLSFFSDEQHEILKHQVQTQMTQPGIHRIMDQGCGHANTLRKITYRFGKQNPDSQFCGYGVSADFKAMWLGQRKYSWEFLTAEEERLSENYGINSFNPDDSYSMFVFSVLKMIYIK